MQYQFQITLCQISSPLSWHEALYEYDIIPFFQCSSMVYTDFYGRKYILTYLWYCQDPMIGLIMWRAINRLVGYYLLFIFAKWALNLGQYIKGHPTVHYFWIHRHIQSRKAYLFYHFWLGCPTKSFMDEIVFASLSGEWNGSDWFEQFVVKLWWNFTACQSFVLCLKKTQSHNTTLCPLQLGTIFLKYKAPNSASLKDAHIFPSNSFQDCMWPIYIILIPDNNLMCGI